MAGEKIHFSRTPKASELRRLLGTGIKRFFMPKSAFTRLSSKARKLLDDAEAEIVIQSARGRPIEVSPEKLLEIVELHRDNRTYRQIEAALGIPKSTAHYLVKYAERQKVKRGGKIVYL